MNFVFELSPVYSSELLGETASALEKHTELQSREKYPKMWEKTDKNGGKPAKMPGRLVSKPMSWVLILLGVFIFIPSMRDPLNMLIPLCAGAAAILIGLCGIRSDTGDRFDKAAKKIFQDRVRLPGGRYSIVFGDSGMSIMDGGKEENLVPYKDIECIIGTQNIFHVFFGGRVLLLLKSEIREGTPEDFASDIVYKTNYTAI